MSVTYNFVYKKDGTEHQETFVFDHEPTFDEIETKMNSFNPDEKINYVRVE